MNIHTNRIFIICLATLMILSIFAGVVNAGSVQPPLVSKVSLSNVRDYAAAELPKSQSYAVDGGQLFATTGQGWTTVQTPENVIVGAVAIDPNDRRNLFIGAANELTLYRSTDGGQEWVRIPLVEQGVGGVTDIAVDGAQRLVYAGTDTAGIFRMRDVGSSVIVGGQLRLDEPVVQVVTDNTGKGLAFARTERALYRAENYGMAWRLVDNLGTSATAVAIANTLPATIYVGTTDRGLLKSEDGLTWKTANNGLNLLPGSRLQVDALAIDPTQPNVLYVATSYLYGSTTLHQSPVGVALSENGSQNWSTLHSQTDVAIVDLLPVSGQPGAVYALTNQSRTPVAVGKVTPATVVAETVGADTSNAAMPFSTIAWIVAGLAALALVFAIANDLRLRRTLATQPAPAV